ncbi:MAG: hypothetical protein ACI9EF_002971 [Pseudohongiellaceae bacterium]|jgi:hypothetical protein
MKTLLVPQVALATLALVPNLFAQESHERTGLVEFTRPAVAVVQGTAAQPRVRIAQLDETLKLGVMVSDSDDGVVISEVFDGSLADRAGLAADDILFKIGGKRVNGAGDIAKSLAAANKSQPVSITVIRPGEGLVTLEGEILASAPVPTKLALTTPSGGGFLGVEMGGASSSGVTIDKVIANSAAWFAGLEGGDVLTTINGHQVTTAEEVAEAIGSQKAGEMVDLSYTRGGATQSSQIRLGHRVPSNLSLQGNALLENSALGGIMQFALPGGDDEHNIFFNGDGAATGHSWFFDHDGDDSDGNVFIIDGENVEWAELHESMAERHENLTELHEALDDFDEKINLKLHMKLNGGTLQDLEGLHQLKDIKGLKGLLKLKDMKAVKGLHGSHQIKALNVQGLSGLQALDKLNILQGHGGSTKVLQSIYSDSDSAETLSITIEDGVMTINRDGEVQVIEMEGDGEVDLQALGGLEKIGFVTSGSGVQILGNVGTTVAISSSSSTSECSVAAEECSKPVEACAEAAEECAELAEACAEAAEECCEEDVSETDSIN